MSEPEPTALSFEDVRRQQKQALRSIVAWTNLAAQQAVGLEAESEREGRLVHKFEMDIVLALLNHAVTEAEKLVDEEF